ncbi:NlpC/P60 family protein [Streptomyces sp. SGAir0957]
MTSSISDAIGERIGTQIGTQIAGRITASIRDGVRDGITQGGQTARPAATRQGSDTGGAFARSFKARVTAALSSLPDVQLNADSTDAEREIAAIRAQLVTLRDAKVGVDIDATEASARIARLQERLQRLTTGENDVNVRIDAGQAEGELAAFQASVNRIDGQTATVDVDTRSAAANLNLLTTAAITFGPALIPALPVVAAGLGSIAAAATAAGVGIGAIALVAMPAFKQITSVLQAQKAAQNEAATATNTGGQAAAQAASKANQLASAQAAVASAERNGARQIAAAQKAVTQARQNAGQVAAQAAQRTAEAARRVQDAEESLSDAQRDARRAQEDLTAARRTAALELEDLNTRLADSVLSQRDAEIALKEATLERDRVLKDQKSSPLDKEKALLQYDQAVQRLKEQTTETSRLKTETAAANKAGVDGSETVRAAQEKIAAAQDTVADRTRDLKDAQAEQARTAVQNGQDIAKAQEQIADAQARVGEAQQQAAEQAASAQRQLAQAQQSTATSAGSASTAQSRYQQELAKLSPSARATYDAFLNLRTAFGAWSKSLQPAVMPLFTRALDGIRRALPGLTPFVLGAADAIGVLQDKASAGFKSPWWKTFKKDLAGSVKPAIVGLGVAFGRIFKGMAGIIGAFLPHMDDISSSMQRITKRFSDWGQGLKGSPAFERFLSYSADKAPLLGDALGKVAGAFIDIGTALAPVSGPLLQVIGALAQGIGWLASNVPGLAIGIYALFVATKLWAAAQLVMNGLMTAFQFIMSLGPWGWIVIAIVAVVAAVVLMYNKFDWFRAAVDAIWAAIKVSAMWLWDKVLKPVFTWIGDLCVWLWSNVIKPYFGYVVSMWKRVASVAQWLWEKVLSPVFHKIADIISWWWNNIVKPYFGHVKEAVGKLGDIFKWLYNNIIKPVWKKIRDAISWAWDHVIKPVFDKLKSAVKKVAQSFEDARDFIKKAWDKLSGIAKKPVRFIINTVYNKGIVPVWNKVATAFGADPIERMDISGWASGGVLPGYTPGRDPHKFYSPSGMGLELSGGEAIMRPEFTRAVGAGFVNTMNAAAKNRGPEGVRAALAPMLGGNPTMKFADGGIFGWIGKAKNAVAGAGSAAWEGVKKVAGWLKDGLEASARAGVKHVVDPLLAKFPGASGEFGKMIRRIPNKVVDTLFGYSKTADKKGGAGGTGGPRITAALNWAKSQQGKPYIWGGVGPKGYDCSGFMSAIENVIRGTDIHRRRWATASFGGKRAAAGWVYHGDSAFKVGITNAGVGHTAGTLGKTNVESRGGQGVVVGSAARGFKSSLFTDWYGFQPAKYDRGGFLQPGFNLAYNGTGRPEPVLTGSQFNSMASRQESIGDVSVKVFVGDREITDIARTEVQMSQQRLIQRLRAK